MALLPARTTAIDDKGTVLSDRIQSDSTLHAVGDIAVPYNDVEQIIGKNINALPLFRQTGTVTLFSYRGTDPSNNLYRLNGIRVTDPFTGRMIGRVSPLALSSVGFLAFDDPSAGLGDPNSLAMTTRSGGGAWHGAFEGITDNTIGSNYDRNSYTARAGGPVPGFERIHLSGLVERRYHGDREPSVTTGDVLPDGSSSFPGNWLDGWAYNGRVDYQVKPDMILSATIDGSRTEYSQYIHAYYFDWPHLPYHKDDFLSLSAQIAHRLSPTVDYTLRLAQVTNESFEGDGVVKEDLAAYVRPYANPEYDDYHIFLSWDNEDSVTDWDESHYYNFYERHKSVQRSISGEIRKKLGKKQRLELGYEWRRTAVRLYSNTYPTDITGPGEDMINHYGYDIEGNEADDGGDWGNGVVHTDEAAVRLSGHLNYGDLTVVPGVTWQLFANDALIPEYRSYPFGSDWVYGPDDTKPTPDYTRWSPSISIDVKMSEVSSLFGRASRTYCQFPYSEMFLGASFFAARIVSGSYELLPSPSLEPREVKDMEFGVSVDVPEKISARASVFSRDEQLSTRDYALINYGTYYYGANDNELSTWAVDLSAQARVARHLDIGFRYTVLSDQTTLILPEEIDNAYWTTSGSLPKESRSTNIKGMKILQIRGGVDFAGGEGPLFGGVPLLENTRLGLLWQHWSGHKYTPTNIYNEISATKTFSHPAGPTYSASTPEMDQIDLSLERAITINGTRLVAFVWVENLLNEKNILEVYTGTGSPDSTGYLSTPEGQMRLIYDQDHPSHEIGFEERYLLATQSPLNYGLPRQVSFGLRVEF